MASQSTAGTLYVVPTPIGNLNDITLRALAVLQSVKVIAAEDTRSTKYLLTHHRIAIPELISFFEGNETLRTEKLLQTLASGQDVAVVSEAGMPGISDPGFCLVEQAVAQKLRVIVLPGASAVTTAVVGSGLPTGQFYFAGFLPRQSGARRRRLFALRSVPATLVFYEAPHRVRESLIDMAAVLRPERRVAVARELSKFYEEYLRSTLGQINEALPDTSIRGEFTIVVEGAAEESDFDLEGAIRARLAAGEGSKEIATFLTTTTGISKRKIYELALTLAKRKA